MPPAPIFPPASARTRGLTLVEIMVAAVISGIVIVAVLSVLLQTLKAYSFENGQLNVNLDMRKFTNQLTADALPAAYFKVVNAYGDASAAFNSYDLNPAYMPVSPAAEVTAGDCVIFVHKDPADDSRFTKVIVYFRVPDARNEGTVRRVEVNLASNGRGAMGPISTLMPSIGSPLTRYPPVVALARGLGTGGKIFDRLNDHSLVVNCEIVRAPAGQFRRASRTFRFSVTPR